MNELISRCAVPGSTCRLLQLEASGARPVWAVLDAAGIRHFTGEITLHVEPTVRAWFQGGELYYATRDGDPELADRLLDMGVVTEDDLVAGSVELGAIRHLGRLFDRVPTLDRDRVELALEVLTGEVVGEIADHVVTEITLASYRHHPSGVVRWQKRPSAPYAPIEDPVAAAPAASDTPTVVVAAIDSADDLVPTAEDEALVAEYEAGLAAALEPPALEPPTLEPPVLGADAVGVPALAHPLPDAPLLDVPVPDAHVVDAHVVDAPVLEPPAPVMAEVASPEPVLADELAWQIDDRIEWHTDVTLPPLPGAGADIDLPSATDIGTEADGLDADELADAVSQALAAWEMPGLALGESTAATGTDAPTVHFDLDDILAQVDAGDTVAAIDGGITTDPEIDTEIDTDVAAAVRAALAEIEAATRTGGDHEVPSILMQAALAEGDGGLPASVDTWVHETATAAEQPADLRPGGDHPGPDTPPTGGLRRTISLPKP